MNVDQAFGGMLKTWCTEKIKAINIINMNGANLAYNHGRDVAQKLGLDPETIMPYPATQTFNINVEPEPEPEPVSSLVKKLMPLIIGASLGAGGLLGYSAMSESPVVPEVIRGGELGFTVE